MSTEKYGIAKVVGGFGRSLSPEEAIPYTLARTHIEHETIRRILSNRFSLHRRKKALEVGCGYGRNLPVLKEVFTQTFGLERDEELATIAANLHQDESATVVRMPKPLTRWPFDHGLFDFVMTFTVLQHLQAFEFEFFISEINRVTGPNATLLIVEETDETIVDPHTTGRSIETYKLLFSEFEFINSLPRKVEKTFPKEDSGAYMLFQKKKQ